MPIEEQTNHHTDRFRGGASAYAAYLETPEGRLRSALAFANVREFLPPVEPPLCLHALDIGSGTGKVTVCLARLGVHVTLLDSSPEMLDLADRAARETGVGDRIALREGDARQVASLFPGVRFDVILCHNVLEFVDDPVAVLCGAAHLMSETSVLSVMVRTQAGEVMKAAIRMGDLAGAERSLTAEWGCESLYGGTARLFTPAGLEVLLRQAGLVAVTARGIRVIADYLPPAISFEAEYERIFELERKLGSRPEFAAVARYAQFLVRHA